MGTDAEISIVEPQWAAPTNVKAVTTLRCGGVSQLPFNGLNLGLHVGDDEQNVIKNRSLLADKLGLPSEPVWLNQTHSTIVFNADVVNTDDVNANKVQSYRSDLLAGAADIANADASVTRQAGVVCAIMTADCLPLFLTNKQGTQVALVHAGWRGMADGIIEKTVEQFDQPSDQLIAWSGPCISVKNFEIGAQVKNELGGSDSFYESLGNDKYYADLYRLADERLSKVGVTDHSWNSFCTYQQRDKFYSYRREGQTGRMASLIWME